MSRKAEKDRLSGELLSLRALAARFRRQIHYMSRNRDGEYSVRDLSLASFAASTADSLADHVQHLADRCDAKDEADKRYRQRCEIADLHDHMTENFFPTTVLQTKQYEEVNRDNMERIEEASRNEIEWKFRSTQDIEMEDREAEQRATAAAKSGSTRHKFLHLKWCEFAVREDLANEETGDRTNILAAFHAVKIKV